MRELPVQRGAADASLAHRRAAEAAKEQELRDGLVRRHFAVMGDRQLLDRLHFEHALSQAPVLRAIAQRDQRG